VIHQTVSHGIAVFAGAWLPDWLAKISADLREAIAYQRRFATMRYINPRTLLYVLYFISKVKDLALSLLISVFSSHFLSKNILSNCFAIRLKKILTTV